MCAKLASPPLFFALILALTLPVLVCSCVNLPDTGQTVPSGEFSRVYGEFQDETLYRSMLASNPAMAEWSDRDLVDGLSGATMQTKTMGEGLGDRVVYLDGRKVAWADGFGQFWLRLPPGEYTLTGRCRGYESATVKIRINGDSKTYANFFMRNKRR